jgi:hypothetical protein
MNAILFVLVVGAVTLAFTVNAAALVGWVTKPLIRTRPGCRGSRRRSKHHDQ